MTRPENPLLTVPPRPKRLDIAVDGVCVRALVDSGVKISVITSDLCLRLKTIPNPFPSCVLGVADGSTLPVLGTCTALVTIGNWQIFVFIHVLPHSPHDIIVGLTPFPYRNFCADRLLHE